MIAFRSICAAIAARDASKRVWALLAADRRASIAVEFGIIAPVLFLLLLGLIEGGRMLWMLNALHYSVQEAARCASINSALCGNAALTQNFAATRAGVRFDASVFSAIKSPCGNLVTARYPMDLAIPFVGSSLTLTASSCYPI